MPGELESRRVVTRVVTANRGLTVEISSPTNDCGSSGACWGCGRVSEWIPVGARQHPLRLGTCRCAMRAHNTLRTSLAALLTKLTHPIVVDFTEWQGLAGVDAVDALARSAGAQAIEDFDVADAKEAIGGASAQQVARIGQRPRTGNRSPLRSLRRLSRDTPDRLTPCLCSGALHGNCTGARPSPRGRGPQRVERACFSATNNCALAGSASGERTWVSSDERQGTLFTPGKTLERIAKLWINTYSLDIIQSLPVHQAALATAALDPSMQWSCHVHT